MGNELKDIVERLNRDYEGAGWVITSAAKQVDGGWNLTIQPITKPGEISQEAANDNN